MTKTRNWTVIAVAAAALIAASSAPATAHSPHQKRAQPLHIGLTGVSTCDGALTVSFGLETLKGAEWTFRMDDGQQDIQIHEISGRSGPGGQWMSVGASSGGEGHLRWVDWQRVGTSGMHVDLVRVIRTDGTHIASSPRLVPDCTRD